MAAYVYADTDDIVMNTQTGGNNHRSLRRDSYGQHQNSGYDNDTGHNQTSRYSNDNGARGGKSRKKQKNNNTDHDLYMSLIEDSYEGNILAPSGKQQGSKLWSSVNKTVPPSDSDQLKALAAQHRKKRSNRTLQQRFDELDDYQQAIVMRLTEQRRNNETNQYAEWIIKDIWKNTERGSMFSAAPKQTTLYVTWKRTDATRTKTRDFLKPRSKFEALKPLEIINKASKDNKKNRRSQGGDDFYSAEQQYVTHDNGNGHGNNIGYESIPPPQQHHQQHLQHQQQQGLYADEINHYDTGYQQQTPTVEPYGMPPPPPPPPTSTQYQDDIQYAPQPPPPPPQQYPSARQPSYSNPRPFQPHPHLDFPAQQNLHDIQLGDFSIPDPVVNPRRNSSSRHNSKHRPGLSKRDYRDEEDLAEDMRRTNLDDTDSEDDDYHDGVFDRSGREERNYTPSSSPPSVHAKHGLKRSKSRNDRDHRHNDDDNDRRARHRSLHHQDVDYESAYTSRDDRRYESGSRHRPSGSRSQLRRSQTYDDYPKGQSAEVRNFPAPLRKIEYECDDDRYDFQKRTGGGRDGRNLARRATVTYEPCDNGYGGGGRRDLVRDERRHGSLVGVRPRADTYHY